MLITIYTVRLLFKSLGSVRFIKTLFIKIKQRSIKLIESDSENFYNVLKKKEFQVNAVLYNFLFIK